MGCAWTSQALALQVVAEQRFASSQGEPVTQELLFNGSGYADFVLRVQNGAADGSQRVSSALVSLNGVKILAPADFNQNVSDPGAGHRATAGRQHPVGHRAQQPWRLPARPGPRCADLPVAARPGTCRRRPRWKGWMSTATASATTSSAGIYLTYPDSEKLRRALIQEYYPLQNMIIHGQQQNRDASVRRHDRPSEVERMFALRSPE